MRKLSENWIDADDPNINQRLDNRPERGRFVYRKNDPDKKLHVAKMQENHATANFIKEIEITQLMDHPNIVKVLDYDVEAEKPWMVTEYCEGGELYKADFLKWTVEERLQCLHEIQTALAYINTKGYARGPAPWNVWLKADGRTPIVGDFDLTEEINEQIMLKQMRAATDMFTTLFYGMPVTQRHIDVRGVDEQIARLKAERRQILDSITPIDITE